jgi:hypothetical protein
MQFSPCHHNEDPLANICSLCPECRTIRLQPACPECHQSGAILVTPFSFLQSTQKRGTPFFFQIRSRGEDQGLSDSSITPRSCASRPHPPALLRGAPQGLADCLSLFRIYTVVHSIGPSVVIALHSEDVSALSEELFQLLGFSVTQV